MNLEFVSHFSAVDWTIVVAYLALTVGIGIWANRAIRSMSDYLVAGRSVRSFLGIATMVGSELGLVTVMYASQKGFTGGFAAFHIGLVAGIVTLIVGFTGFIVVPLRRLGVMTIPEYYEIRFGRGVRVLGGLLLAVAGILNMGMFLKAGALFVSGLTGLGDTNTIQWIMTALIALVLLYTILGGMVSVVITDYLQFVVLSIGMLIACGLAFRELGWTELVEGVNAIHGESGFNPLHTEGFGPSYIVWQIFTAGLVSCAIWQTAVMRACSAESTSVVRKLYMFSSIGFLIRFLLPQFLGICALVYFCRDPQVRETLFPGGVPSGDPAVKDWTLQAMPVFLGQILPVGLLGLIASGMLAAFMSTHDSYLLCWASVLSEDVVHPAYRTLTGKSLTMKTRLFLSRTLIVVIGAFLLFWSLWYPLGSDLWDYMAISGAIYFTGAFALLVLGLYWKRASRAGAIGALLSGLLAIAGLDPVRKELELPPWITSTHVGLATTAQALILMIALSLLVPDRPIPLLPIDGAEPEGNDS